MIKHKKYTHTKEYRMSRIALSNTYKKVFLTISTDNRSQFPVPSTISVGFLSAINPDRIP